MAEDELRTESLALLGEVLTYVLVNEQQHYAESGKPDDHIYVKALTCALRLQLLVKAKMREAEHC